MSPEIFRAQLAEGAWGMTVADPQQAMVAADAGAKNILIANEVVDAGNLDVLRGLLARGSVEVFVCVDSVAGVQRLAHASGSNISGLHLLIEIGVPGGRCGIRTDGEAKDIAAACAAQGLSPAGVEGYEGILSYADDGREAFEAYFDLLSRVWRDLPEEGRKILSVGGSAYYDLIVNRLRRDHIAPGGLIVMRPGCYVTHDGGMYRSLFEEMRHRHPDIIGADGGLHDAMYLVTTVLSVPEQGLCVADMGRRAVGYDQGLPWVDCHWSGDMAREVDLTVRELNDQHCILTGDCGGVAVGDRLVMRAHHPCTTFDKWRALPVSDGAGGIDSWVTTRFGTRPEFDRA